MVGLRVGIDLVRVSRIAESLDQFGERFLRRLFADDEIAYASAAPILTAERFDELAVSLSHKGDFASAVVITSHSGNIYTGATS